MFTCLALNILSKALTDAMCGSRVHRYDVDSSSLVQADDILASDPIAAPMPRRASLSIAVWVITEAIEAYERTGISRTFPLIST